MDITFPLILVLAVFITGVMTLFDHLILRPKRRKAVLTYQAQVGDNSDPAHIQALAKPMGIMETARSIFPVLALVLVLRSFLFEPYQIPSGSMTPTLQVGDFILVNKYAYGLRLPVIGTHILSVGEPQRGEVMVFKEPNNPGINFIKRVIGVPGDTVRYANKRLTINDEPVPETFTAQLQGEGVPYRLYEEALYDHHHAIRKDRTRHDPSEGVWTVPQGHYFVMGDNRDNSNDSRYWGFVPEQNIVGKAVYIWLHWPSWTRLPRFQHNGAIH